MSFEMLRHYWSGDFLVAKPALLAEELASDEGVANFTIVPVRN
jgi:hypothetical protein